MDEKLIEIPLFDWEGYLQDYIEYLSKNDPYVLGRLKALGLPSEGHLRISKTPGNAYGRAYSNFTVNSLAVLLGDKDEIDSDSLGGILHLSAPEDESVWRLWRVWLMDIVRNEENQDSCIRYMWNEIGNGGKVTIESISNDLRRFEKPDGSGYATRHVIAQLKRLLPGLKIISLEEANSGRGRPQGTGWFINVKDFRTALKEVLAVHPNRPTQLDTLRLLDGHRLCRLKPREPRNQSHTKTLRDWLHRARIKNFDEALRKYWKPLKKRE